VILVDTSIWISLLKSKPRAAITPERLVTFVTCGPIIQEVLQGLGEGPLSNAFREDFLVIPRLSDPIPVAVFLQAAEIYQQGRRKGYTIRSSIDCLIAAIAIQNDVPVWHRDRDYSAIARFTSLRNYTGTASR
jgi:predicted nucleic acid-binding protein